MKTMKKAFLGMIWSGSFIACSLSAAILVNVWAKGFGGGLEMFRLGMELPFLLPLLALCSIYRCFVN